MQNRNKIWSFASSFAKLHKNKKLELLRRGYKVNIGKSNDYIVDFVAESPNDIKYYQVTRSLTNEEVKTRDLRSLESINDNYEKTILTMDKSINNDYNGIKVVNIIDWLLKY